MVDSKKPVKPPVIKTDSTVKAAAKPSSAEAESAAKSDKEAPPAAATPTPPPVAKPATLTPPPVAKPDKLTPVVKPDTSTPIKDASVKTAPAKTDKDDKEKSDKNDKTPEKPEVRKDTVKVVAKAPDKPAAEKVNAKANSSVSQSKESKQAARVITITSGKGGVGKTTATANLAVALASLGNKVVCIDADIGLRNLDVVMGLENRIVYDLVDVIEGRARLRQAMIKDKRLPEELYLIPAAQTRDKTAVSPGDMVRICDELSDMVDFIIIDSPAGIERGFRNAVAPADEVIIVTNPEVAAVRDADRIIGLIEAEQKGPGQLILNRVKPEMIKRGDMLAAEDVIDILAIKLLGIVPEDEDVLISSNRGTPVTLDEKSRAGQAFRNIAKRLTGEDVPLMDLEVSSGLFGKLSRMMRSPDKK